MILSGSPRFDVYGSDFGRGRPLAVRTCPGNKLDRLTTVFVDGRGAGGHGTGGVPRSSCSREARRRPRADEPVGHDGGGIVSQSLLMTSPTESLVRMLYFLPSNAVCVL